MQVDSNAQVDEQKQYKAIPFADSCQRVLYRQSNCDACAQVCPSDAISFPLEPQISDSCIDCGLCQVACPTEVFEDMFHTDQLLMDNLQIDVRQNTVQENLYIHCHQAQPHTKDSVFIKCTGHITENTLLAATLAGTKQILASTGRCKDCQLSKGAGLFKQAAATYKQLAIQVANHHAEIKVREIPKQIEQKSTVSRREFFSKITNNVAKHAAQVVVEKGQNLRELLKIDEEKDSGKRESPRRAALRELLAAISETPRPEIAGTELPWKKMLVDEPNCVGCGICVSVCPTGALVKEVGGTELTRYINHALCTNCGLCAEACPQDIIRFEQPYVMQDIVQDSKEVVAVVPLNACVICGETIPVSEGEVCTTCQKRQVVPMFVKL